MADPTELARLAIDALALAHPGVRIDPALVTARVTELPAVDPAHLGELALAWACLAGDPEAQRAIDHAIRAEAVRAARELRQPAWLVDEIHQELAQRLLVGAEPRLASYAGGAALGRWLGVAALRTALNLARRERRETPLANDSLAAAVTAPELALVRDRYRDAVQSAIRAAFEALDSPRDRNLLRLYYLDRVPLDRLGPMFGVHASTVSRWLAAVRDAILEDTRARLAEHLGLAGDAVDVDSLIRAVRSDLDVTLSRILG